MTLTSTASDAGSGVASRAYEYSPAGAGSWSSTPAAFDTTAVSDGLYDLRVIVTDVAGNQTTSAAVANRRVDNTNPNASMDDPGANLRGTVTLSSTASDSGSGIASRAYEYSPAGAGSWSSSPAAFDTTGVSDGLYDLRVIVTDVAGNSTTSALVANRRVDNTAPSASLTSPADASFVSATVAVSANSTDPGGSGTDSVLFERRPVGGGSWTTIDTDSSSPYSVSWDTGSLADGDYELRAHATDQAGNSQLSALRTVTVDNTAPSASMDDPGTPLRGTVSLSGGRRRRGRLRSRLAHLPALARKRRHLDDRGHGHGLALLGLLRHDRGLGRALRPARGRNRRRSATRQSRPSSRTAASTTRRRAPRSTIRAPTCAGP